MDGIKRDTVKEARLRKMFHWILKHKTVLFVCLICFLLVLFLLKVSFLVIFIDYTSKYSYYIYGCHLVK